MKTSATDRLTNISLKLQNWSARLERSKDRVIMLERKLQAEKGKIGWLERKIEKYQVYKLYYEREARNDR